MLSVSGKVSPWVCGGVVAVWAGCACCLRDGCVSAVVGGDRGMLVPAWPVDAGSALMHMGSVLVP